jgi:hypothetical protein
MIRLAAIDHVVFRFGFAAEVARRYGAEGTGLRSMSANGTAMAPAEGAAG